MVLPQNDIVEGVGVANLNVSSHLFKWKLLGRKIVLGPDEVVCVYEPSLFWRNSAIAKEQFHQVYNKR